MKTSYILKTLVILLFVLTASAQQGINYKAMIKDANGDVITNTVITVQFIILENGTTEVFQESHNPTTDASGIIIVNIGEGTLISGDFNAIDWGSNAHYLNTKIDSGDGLTDMGTTEFKTVPYALYARNSGNIVDLSNFEEGDILQYNGTDLVPATFSLYYQDNDKDGYGNKNGFVYTSFKPTDFIERGGDTDDDNFDINPDVEDICGDGIDNNSDGEIDESCDVDRDGFNFDVDCNDNDPGSYPGAEEVPDDGIDQDCDGRDLKTWYSDFDGDGYLDLNRTRVQNTKPDGYYPFDQDNQDCDDDNFNVHPGAPEICDGIDNDCNGVVDEDCITLPKVGDLYQGGVIYYILKPEDMGYVRGETHGLIVAIANLGPIDWQESDSEYLWTYANGTAIGTGLSNTNLIISTQGGVEINYAAGLARAYKGGGYTDWFLPSMRELRHVYLQWEIINIMSSENGGDSFSPNLYLWSSTEYDDSRAWGLNSTNELPRNKKGVLSYFRPIRAF